METARQSLRIRADGAASDDRRAAGLTLNVWSGGPPMQKSLSMIYGLGIAMSVGAVTAAEAVEPERQPIYANIVGGLLCGTSSANQCKVPAGQRLIIEYVSGYIFAPVSPSPTKSVTMAITDQGLGLNGAGFHVFPATKVNTAGTTDVFAFSAPLKMMLHPNATFYFSNVAGISVSGYLVNFAGP
jgi:hypothetical protein